MSSKYPPLSHVKKVRIFFPHLKKWEGCLLLTTSLKITGGTWSLITDQWHLGCNLSSGNVVSDGGQCSSVQLSVSNSLNLCFLSNQIPTITTHVWIFIVVDMMPTLNIWPVVQWPYLKKVHAAPILKSHRKFSYVSSVSNLFLEGGTSSY